MNVIKYAVCFGLLTVFCNACSTEKNTENNTMQVDSHTYANPEKGKINHLNLAIEVDFDEQIIHGEAKYSISNHQKQIIFDTYDLIISAVSVDGKEIPFELGPKDAVKGQALIVPVEPTSSKVAIQYKTAKNAKALLWLTPEQTASKTHPFLFTQSQAILARSWIPIQDSPGIRFTYNAKVTVPEGMMAVMSAENDTLPHKNGVYEFEMKQAIPAYLMALAVGNLEFKAISERAGVFAEPNMIEKSVAEFNQVEDMIVAAEALYGPYVWERYDIIVLPPSFPFGGMENPRLTFATPTIIAGDQSLVSLIAHELAHSWSGNLVTNSTWNDFWLNEGFTVYFERRIMEAIEGKTYADMLEVLGYQDLVDEVTDIGEKHPDTHLKLELKERDPDEGMTDIAYEKGYFFLRMLENHVGRAKLDDFLRQYFKKYAFKVMDTEGFLNVLYTYFPSVKQQKEQLLIQEWIYGPGIPENCPVPSSIRFEQVDLALVQFTSTMTTENLSTDNWSTHEWLYFLRGLAQDITDEKKLLTAVKRLDQAYALTESGNNEILAAWFQLTIKAGYAPANGRIRTFLIEVGRRKFLTPTYKALIEADSSKKWAQEIYELARPNYHSVATHTIDQLLF